MSTHIGAEPGEIAPHVLMPGDPLRAKWIAETFLDDATCYSEVRGMYGFTGTWKGQRVSVQGSGMGMPSISIYVNELFKDYGVQAVTRVGSCGALSSELALRDLVIASGACTDSSMNRITFEGLDYAPVADFDLLRGAWEAAQGLPVTSKVGLIMSSDSFYASRPELTTPLPRSTRARRWPSAPSRTTSSPARRPRPPSGRRPSATWSRSPCRRCSRADQGLELLATRQALRRDDRAVADVVELGADPVERQTVQLGPGHAVDRQLEGVGGLAAAGLPVHEQP
jgi:purine-nucleoside phosphorylase